MDEEIIDTGDGEVIQQTVEEDLAQYLETSPESPLILDIAASIQRGIHRYYMETPDSEMSILYEDEEKVVVEAEEIWITEWTDSWGLLSEGFVFQLVIMLSGAHFQYAQEIIDDDSIDFYPMEVFVVLTSSFCEPAKSYYT